MKKYIYLLLIIFVQNINKTFSQTILPDSISAPTATINTINFYYSQIGENSHLFIGSEIQYPRKDAVIRGDQFLDTSAMRSGSVFYNGTLYHNVLLLYDIYHDAVITYSYKQYFKLALVREKVKYFTILNDTFIRIVKDSTSQSLRSSGFYQILYNGKTKAFVKREKIIDANALGGDNNTLKFEQHNYYFIKRDDHYYPVINQKSLFLSFADKGKMVRSYLRKKKISFRKEREYAIANAAQYFDQLTN